MDKPCERDSKSSGRGIKMKQYLKRLFTKELEDILTPPPAFLAYKNRKITLGDVELAIKNHFGQDTDPAYVQANLGHALRYFYALKYIIEHEIYKGNIFEAGGKGVFTSIIKSCLKDVDIFSYEGDLRQPIPMDEAGFDAVLCMEVVEHITDEKNYHEMRFEGVKTCMQSFFRILKPGGQLLLTTPNAISALSLHHLIYASHPMTYPIHVREYTPKEIQDIAELIGFQTRIITTENVFTSPEVLKTAYEIFNKNGFPIQNRGDDIIAIFTKPENMAPKDPDLVKELFFTPRSQ